MRHWYGILCAALISTVTVTADSPPPQGDYAIGDTGPAGGIIFHDKGAVSDGWRYLEAAPEDQGTSAWGCADAQVPGAHGDAIGTGRANTAAILAACSGKSAARLAADYDGGGMHDWFLPAKAELSLMYTNLHRAGLGDFRRDYYWSSTEDDLKWAWNQSFKAGDQFCPDKKLKRRVRAVRAF